MWAILVRLNWFPCTDRTMSCTYTCNNMLTINSGLTDSDVFISTTEHDVYESYAPLINYCTLSNSYSQKSNGNRMNAYCSVFWYNTYVVYDDNNNIIYIIGSYAVVVHGGMSANCPNVRETSAAGCCRSQAYLLYIYVFSPPTIFQVPIWDDFVLPLEPGTRWLIPRQYVMLPACVSPANAAP